MSDEKTVSGEASKSVQDERANSVGKILEDAVRHHKQGELGIAKKLYHQILHQIPDHADSKQYLGMLMFQQGDAKRGESLVREAIKISPSSAQYHDNLGTLLESTGRLMESLEAYRRAELLQPGNSLRAYNIGFALMRTGEYEEALSYLHRALGDNPENIQCMVHIANCYKGNRQIEKSLEYTSSALSLDNRNILANLVHANTLDVSGQYELAANTYEHIVALFNGKPDRQAKFKGKAGIALLRLGKAEQAMPMLLEAAKQENADAETRLWLVRAQTALGQIDDAVRTVMLVAQQDPNLEDLWDVAVGAILKWRPVGYISGIEQLLIDLPARSGCSVQMLAPIICGQIIYKYDINQNTDNSPELLQRFSEDPLVLMLFTQAIAVNGDLELWLLQVRKRLLMNLNVVNTHTSLCELVAIQASNNEYVWFVDEDEITILDNLEKELLAANDSIAIDKAIIYAMYRPLEKLIPTDKAWPSKLNRLRNITVGTIERSRKHTQQLDSLGEPNDEVSKRVREMYEQNPYPRWLSLYRPRSQPLYESYAGLIDIDVPDILAKSNIKALVAGCGTGQEALSFAVAHPEIEFTAIDLSRNSLGYAMMKAEELDVSNIKFVHGDLLQAEQLKQQYDVIFCAGVLHHMDNPIAGFAALKDVLVENGVMRIALYSAQARASVVRARDIITTKGYDDGIQSISRFRHQVLTRSIKGLDSLVQSPDFYTASEVKDLLFHTQEHRFSLEQIETMLQQYGMKFLAMELPHPAIKQQFLRHFNDLHALKSLSSWSEFEKIHTKTFSGMYVFWCQHEAS